MIALEHVRKRFAGKSAVDDVCFVVAEGARVALVGASGSGKSTLLRLVLGLVTPDSGTVRVLGEVPTLELRRRIGYVVQDGGLFPHLTCEENVTLVARSIGVEPSRIESRVAELATLVRLDRELLGRYPTQVSGGQRQRVGIMRALVLDPPLLLLDEPMGALDSIVRAKLQEDLLEVVVATKKTMLLVTHDLAEAAFLAEDVAVVSEGRIVQRAPFDDLAAHPAHPFVAELVAAQRRFPERSASNGA